MEDSKALARTDFPAAKEANTLLEEWFSLAWRPAGSRSLSSNWMRTGELAPRSKRPKRSQRRTG